GGRRWPGSTPVSSGLLAPKRSSIRLVSCPRTTMYFVGGQLAFGKSILIFTGDAKSPIEEVAIRARTITIPGSSERVSKLPALVVEPDSGHGADSVLLFLHGKGEAGST